MNTQSLNSVIRDIAMLPAPRRELVELPNLGLDMIQDGLHEICRAQGFMYIKYEASSSKFFGVRYVEDQEDRIFPLGDS